MTPLTSKNKEIRNSNISIESLRSGVSQKSDPHNITVNMGTSEQILSPLSYSEEDIEGFRSYVESKILKSPNFNFTKIFIQFRARNCKNEKIQISNIYYKVLYLEYFLSQDIFIGEIYTLSSTRTRTKLAEKLLTISPAELDKIADLIEMCQKRAKLLIESNHFRKHTEG